MKLRDKLRHYGPYESDLSEDEKNSLDRVADYARNNLSDKALDALFMRLNSVWSDDTPSKKE